MWRYVGNNHTCSDICEIRAYFSITMPQISNSSPRKERIAKTGWSQ